METPRLASEHEYEDADFDGIVAPKSLVNTSFESCRFVRCTFEATQFRDCRFVDCIFEHCTLVGVRFPSCFFSGTTFEKGRVMGCDFAGVRPLVFDVSFTDVRMDFTNFSGLSLRGFTFRDCLLREAVFSECDLRRAVFTGSDLEGAVIRHANLQDTDLRDTRGCVIDATSCTLGRTRLDGDTGVMVLRGLGIVCAELERLVGVSVE